jgi:hypothetical protein
MCHCLVSQGNLLCLDSVKLVEYAYFHDIAETAQDMFRLLG